VEYNPILTAVVGRLGTGVQKIFKTLIWLDRKPDGVRQPPLTPPKKGGELTATQYFVLILLPVCLRHAGRLF